jgi:hypothetical protein
VCLEGTVSRPCERFFSVSTVIQDAPAVARENLREDKKNVNSRVER